jgi:hypothetical protein
MQSKHYIQSIHSIDMQKQPIMAIKASKIIKESLDADFIVAPLNSKINPPNFRGTEEELRNYIKRKYDREVEIVA